MWDNVAGLLGFVWILNVSDKICIPSQSLEIIDFLVFDQLGLFLYDTRVFGLDLFRNQ